MIFLQIASVLSTVQGQSLAAEKEELDTTHASINHPSITYSIINFSEGRIIQKNICLLKVSKKVMPGE